MGYLHRGEGADDWQEQWQKVNLWNAGELAMLCCGWNPGDGRHGDGSLKDQSAYNDALELIRRAVKAGDLTVAVPPAWLVSEQDPLFQAVAQFKPVDAIKWAKGQYPDTFPFSPKLEDRPLKNIERTSLLLIIAALAKIAKLKPADAIREIQADLQRAGAKTLDVKTIREKLDDAATAISESTR
jgi:hypothetical protein